jgi:hypothetical protein
MVPSPTHVTQAVRSFSGPSYPRAFGSNSDLK